MNETMPLVLFALNVITTSICVVSAVVAAQKAKLPPSQELQAHVDELGAVVEKLLKEQRKERMSRVRNAGVDRQDNPDVEKAPGHDNVLSHIDAKAALRARARAAGRV